jgi:hypothetical protein
MSLCSPAEGPGARANSMMSVLSDKGKVKKEENKDLVGQDQWCVNNQLDEKYQVSSSKYIKVVSQMAPHELLVKRNELCRE